MKKAVKKIIVLFLLVLTCFTFCACGATVECYYMSDSLGDRYTYYVRLDQSLVNELENNATIRVGSQKWTLSEWFSVFCEIAGVRYYGQETERNEQIYIIVKEVYGDESEDDESEEELEYTMEWGFFQNKYICKQDNPFNGMLNEYQNPQIGSVFDVIRNGASGKINGKDVSLPSFSGAFPATAGKNLSDIELNFCWVSNRINPINGKIIEPESYLDSRYVMWQGKFDNENRTIEYYYYVPNPLGWYVVIGCLGILAVVIVLIVTKNSKKQPKMQSATQGRQRYVAGTRIIYIRPEDVEQFKKRQNPDIYGNESVSEFNPYERPETEQEKARRELEDIFDGKSDDED